MSLPQVTQTASQNPTRETRKLAVVYEMIDDITIYPLTAYDLDD